MHAVNRCRVNLVGMLADNQYRDECQDQGD